MRCTALLVVLAVAVSQPYLQAQARQAAPRTRPQPAVDPLTASISGRVTAADNGSPIRGAEVRTVSDRGVNRLAATDADGRYQIRDLPAGSLEIAVSKSGFAPAQFGQRRPSEAARTIELKQGQRFTADVALLRGGVIAGRIFDRFGEPLAGIRVQALRPRMSEGLRQLQPVGAGDETDDRGAFRVFGLAPGDYYVVARRSRAGGIVHTSDPPMYYPGTADFSQAQRITVTAAAESNVILQLVPVQTATVSGVVLGPSGAPVDATVVLTSESVNLGYVNAMQGTPFMMSTHAEADGTFTITNVPPGAYSLRASSMVKGVLVGDRFVFPGPESQLMATMPLPVAGDVTGLSVMLNDGGSAAGRFVRDAGASGPLPEGLGVRVSGGGMSMHMTGPDNTFRLRAVHGRVRLQVEGLPETWMVKSVLADNEDVTDTGIELANGRETTIRIVLTDRIGEVSGTVSSRAPLGAQTVVVFADDPARWGYPSRFVRTARVDERGNFRVAGLPPERYLAVAVEFLEEGASQDPEVLERLRRDAIPFTLGEGDRRTVDLRSVDR